MATHAVFRESPAAKAQRDGPCRIERGYPRGHHGKSDLRREFERGFRDIGGSAKPSAAAGDDDACRQQAVAFDG